MKKTVAIVCARMDSSRLPGKVLLPLANGIPNLEYLTNNLSTCKQIDEIVIATTDRPIDDTIATHCEKTGVKCFRGVHNYTLVRITQAAAWAEADVIVDVTGDCPLVPDNHLYSLIKKVKKKNILYATNILERKYPDGFDIQVYSAKGLSLLWDSFVNSNIANQPMLEHGGYNFIHTRFHIRNAASCYFLNSQKDYGDYRLTLDTPEDYAVIKKIIQELHKATGRHNCFTSTEIFDVVKSERGQEIMKINSEVRTKTVEEG